jgi:hypothetical protein
MELHEFFYKRIRNEPCMATACAMRDEIDRNNKNTCSGRTFHTQLKLDISSKLPDNLWQANLSRIFFKITTS